jgi:hypothetical protein
MLICLNVVLYASGFQLVQLGNSGKDMVHQFVNDDGENITMSDNRTDDISAMATPGSGIGGFVTDVISSFVDVVIMIAKFFAFLINITLAPIALFTQIPNLPPMIALLVGVPLAAAWYIAIAYFVRGND